MRRRICGLAAVILLLAASHARTRWTTLIPSSATSVPAMATGSTASTTTRRSSRRPVT